MAALLRIPVQDPQNVIDTWGTGALIRVERSTSATMSGASEITTIAVVAGQTEYEYRDTAGTPGTDYYWVRYSKSNPSVADDYSGYGPITLAGALTGEVITLETAKTWANLDGTADDGWLALAVGAVNRAIIGLIGVDLAPSPDTVRTYDAANALRDGTRLIVPGGIRAFTAVEVSTDASTWTAVTSDVRVGPLSHSRAPGEPGHWVEFKPYVSGSTGRFDGHNYVRITGTAFSCFGWDAWPQDVVQDALAAVQRMSIDRSRGGQYPSEIAVLRYLHVPTHRAYSRLYFPKAF